MTSPIFRPWESFRTWAAAGIRSARPTRSTTYSRTRSESPSPPVRPTSIARGSSAEEMRDRGTPQGLASCLRMRSAAELIPVGDDPAGHALDDVQGEQAELLEGPLQGTMAPPEDEDRHREEDQDGRDEQPRGDPEVEFPLQGPDHRLGSRLGTPQPGHPGLTHQV